MSEYVVAERRQQCILFRFIQCNQWYL